jgi:hypothetical protein
MAHLLLRGRAGQPDPSSRPACRLHHAAVTPIPVRHALLFPSDPGASPPWTREPALNRTEQITRLPAAAPPQHKHRLLGELRPPPGPTLPEFPCPGGGGRSVGGGGMLFQVGGQGARPTFFEMSAAQQLPASLRAALTYSLGVQ